MRKEIRDKELFEINPLFLFLPFELLALLFSMFVHDFKFFAMIAQVLWIAGSLILLVLGTLHLAYTFFTDKFSSRNTNVVDEMKQSFPRLTNKTTLWKAWIGFNASHSVGAIFIGLINIILAIQYFEILRQSYLLLTLNILTVAFYLFLAKQFWFKIPFMGILITLLCFIVAAINMFSS